MFGNTQCLENAWGTSPLSDEFFGNLPHVKPKARIISDVLLVPPKELATCNPKQAQSAASRGVRFPTAASRPDFLAPVKSKTIPLLTPEMEEEMIRSSSSKAYQRLMNNNNVWQQPELRFAQGPAASCAAATPQSRLQPRPPSLATASSCAAEDHAEAVTASSGVIGGGLVTDSASVPQLTTWEENFQDLSDWCDTPCEFPAGESSRATSNIITGTLNGGNATIESTTATIPGAVTPTLTNGKFTLNAKGIETNRLGLRTVVQVPPIPRPAPRPQQLNPYQLDHPYPVILPQSNSNNQEQPYYNLDLKTSNIENDIKVEDMEWMKTKVKPEVDTNIDNLNNNAKWSDLNEFDVFGSLTILPLSQQSLDSREINQDLLRSFDSDFGGLDLDSLLNEGVTQSPEDSISTNSSRVTDLCGSLPQFSVEDSVAAQIAVSPITYEPVVSPPSVENTSLRLKVEYSMNTSPSTSTGTSSPLRPISNDRQLRNVSVKIEKPDSPDDGSISTGTETIERRSTRKRRVRELSVSSSTTTNSTRPTKSRRRSYKSISESHDEDGNDVDDLYRETREKNNEASRKSRMNKKAKEMEMAQQEVELERRNRLLKVRAEYLEKRVSKYREILLFVAQTGPQNDRLLKAIRMK
ncbi:hypothetical protein TKK_0013607 [Trichogramma kaykai]|uniref:BZIP domain-containing protein n=1 Tax=Trichogramma kaykai TaxID=54128 RepID=A0ABD2WHK7_9HYME